MSDRSVDKEPVEAYLSIWDDSYRQEAKIRVMWNGEKHVFRMPLELFDKAGNLPPYDVRTFVVEGEQPESPAAAWESKGDN